MLQLVHNVNYSKFSKTYSKTFGRHCTIHYTISGTKQPSSDKNTILKIPQRSVLSNGLLLLLLLFRRRMGLISEPCDYVFAGVGGKVVRSARNKEIVIQEYNLFIESSIPGFQLQGCGCSYLRGILL